MCVCNRGGLDCSNKQHNNNMRVCVCARICMCARWGLRVFTKRIWVTMFTQIFTDNLLISKLRDYYAIFLRFVCSAVCMCVYHSECMCVCAIESIIVFSLYSSSLFCCCSFRWFRFFVCRNLIMMRRLRLRIRMRMRLRMVLVAFVVIVVTRTRYNDDNNHNHIDNKHREVVLTKKN